MTALLPELLVEETEDGELLMNGEVTAQEDILKAVEEEHGQPENFHG